MAQAEKGPCCDSRTTCSVPFKHTHPSGFRSHVSVLGSSPRFVCFTSPHYEGSHHEMNIFFFLSYKKPELFFLVKI